MGSPAQPDHAVPHVPSKRFGDKSDAGALGACAALFLASFAWFILHAVPSVYFGDCGEFLANAARGFVAHPNGFPTYFIFAAPAALAGAFAINLMSSFWAAVTVAAVALLSRRLLLRSGLDPSAALWAACAAAFALAGSSTLTLHAAAARVYTIQAAFLALGMFWTAEYRKTIRWAMGAGFLFGAGLGTHFLFLAVVPFAILMLWGRRRGLTPLLPWAAVGSLLGATVLLWVPIRAAQHPIVVWGDPAHLGGWLRYLSLSLYKNEMFSRDSSALSLFLSETVRSWSNDLSPLIWLLALLGIARLYRVDRPFLMASSSVVLFNLGVFWAFGGEFSIGLLYRYYLPTYAVVALFAAQGWAWIFERKLPVTLRTPFFKSVFLVLLALFSLSVPGRRWRDLDLSSDAWHYAVNILRSIPRGAALEMASDNQIDPLAYARYVRGLRPDVDLVEFSGILFPETVAGMKRNPASTRESVERELLEKGGGSLYLPSQRSVQAPLTCVAWGLSHRLTVSPAHPAPGPNPSLEKMPFRLTEAERNDVEAQDAVGDYLLHRVDRALEAGDPSTALTLLRETENRCSRAPNILVEAAVAYPRAGDGSRVEPLLLRALELRPHHYIANIDLGLYYASRGEYALAKQHLQTAVQAVPGDGLALQYLKQVEAWMSSSR